MGVGAGGGFVDEGAWRGTGGWVVGFGERDDLVVGKQLLRDSWVSVGSRAIDWGVIGRWFNWT